MNLFPLLLMVLALAFFTGSDSLFYLVYFLGGLVVLSRLWMSRALRGVRSVRRFPGRAFYGETVTVELELSNRGRLPLLWLAVNESLPLALHVPNFERRVISLAPGERERISYTLSCQRRGYYHLGPLGFETGDFFGLARDHRAEHPAEVLIVYPKIVPLRALGLPSQIPFGSLSTRNRFFEDPSRFYGLRDYQPGDSLRRVDWKSSARTGTLQIRRFEPAIALHTLIVLDLNSESYSTRARPAAEELGVTVAASLAAHLSELRQAVGLALLGRDPLSGAAGLQTIAPGRGQAVLMRQLELLARAEMAAFETPLAEVLPRATADLEWGSTVVVVTAGEGPGLEAALLQLRRRGLYVWLVALDAQVHFAGLQARLESIGIPAHWVAWESELDRWR